MGSVYIHHVASVCTPEMNGATLSTRLRICVLCVGVALADVVDTVHGDVGKLGQYQIRYKRQCSGPAVNGSVHGFNVHEVDNVMPGHPLLSPNLCTSPQLYDAAWEGYLVIGASLAEGALLMFFMYQAAPFLGANHVKIS